MPIWLAADPLVLASRSSARRMLLTAAGIPVEVQAADIDERRVEAGARSREADAIALLLAHEKAGAVESRHSGRLVLGADQVLALDGKCFAKPSDRAAARMQLCALSGRTHVLHSAVVIVHGTAVVFQHVATAHLTMRAFSDRFLDHYLETVGTAVTQSVGAYQIEGLGAQLFDRIEGDYFTILGLPLMQVLEFLRGYGPLLR